MVSRLIPLSSSLKLTSLSKAPRLAVREVVKCDYFPTGRSIECFCVKGMLMVKFVCCSVIVVLKEQLPHCRLHQSTRIAVTFSDFLMVSSTIVRENRRYQQVPVATLRKSGGFTSPFGKCAAVCVGQYRNRGSFKASVQSLCIVLRHSYRLREESREVYLTEIFLFKDYGAF